MISDSLTVAETAEYLLLLLLFCFITAVEITTTCLTGQCVQSINKWPINHVLEFTVFVSETLRTKILYGSNKYQEYYCTPLNNEPNNEQFRHGGRGVLDCFYS